jgi:hypothetical protein
MFRSAAVHITHAHFTNSVLHDEMRILLLAAKEGPNVLFCMPNRTKCILLIHLHATSFRFPPFNSRAWVQLPNFTVHKLRHDHSQTASDATQQRNQRNGRRVPACQSY